jgi:hypothetical protein
LKRLKATRCNRKSLSGHVWARYLGNDSSQGWAEAPLVHDMLKVLPHGRHVQDKHQLLANRKDFKVCIGCPTDDQANIGPIAADSQELRVIDMGQPISECLENILPMARVKPFP